MTNLQRGFRLFSILMVMVIGGSAFAQNFGDVVITEVMWDDSFSGTDVEWAEIHNTTGASITLDDWILMDGNVHPPATEGAIRVPAGTSISAGGYLLLCKQDLPDITGEIICTQFFGSWALGNTGDNLALYTSSDAGATLIDGSLTVNYPTTLSTRGVSIEKCDPNSTWTGDVAAWHGSTNLYSPTGRYNYCTPGTANSPCGDLVAPELVDVTVISSTELELLWDEAVGQASAETESNYVVDGGVGSPTLATRDGGNNAIVHLTFNPIPNGTYVITVNGVQDVAGNTSSNQVDTFTVSIIVSPGAVVITEVLYDDTATTDLEWVEIHNTTAAAIDISNWILTDDSQFPPAGEGYLTVPASTIIPADGYLVLTNTAISEFSDEVVCADSANFGLNNNGDNLVLLTPGGTQIVDGSYTTNYPDLAAANAGNSIEKCDVDAQWSGEITDWQVSTNEFATSGRYRHCTPGVVNSPCVPDGTPPTLVSVSMVSGNVIDVLFNESLRDTSANNEANYSVDLGVGAPSNAVLQGDLATVRMTFASAFSPNTYTLTVNNVVDLAGNAIAPNSTIPFTIAAPAESLLVTEIMPNPAAVADDAGEWLEIYNYGSSAVNLAGFVLHDNAGSDTIEAGTINPGDYFVFCNNGDSATNGGVPEDFDFQFGTSGWGLALANSADVITLTNTLGQIVASLSYTASYPFSAGSSAQLSALNLNPADPANWCAATSQWPGSSGDAGTPGEANFCQPPTPPDTVTICEIRSEQDTCGVPTRYQTRVVTYGRITFVDTCQTRAIVWDNDCAVIIFGGAVMDTITGAGRRMLVGDSVCIDGYITQFRGLTEFSTFASLVPEITYLGASAIPDPAADPCGPGIVSIAQNSCEAEPFESRLVKVNNLTFLNAGGTFSVGDSNYVAISGTDTVLFRVDSCDAILGSTIPSGQVNVTAIVGQFDSTGSCFCGGYQLTYGGGNPFEAAVCPDPTSLTVLRTPAAESTTLRWNAGLGSTCSTYKVYASTDGGAVWPNTYSLIATVNVLNYVDTDPLAPKRFYHVTSDN